MRNANALERRINRDGSRNHNSSDSSDRVVIFAVALIPDSLIRLSSGTCIYIYVLSKLIKAIYFLDGICNRSKRPTSEITDGFNDRFLELCHAPESRSIPIHTAAKPQFSLFRSLWPPFTFSSATTATTSLPPPTTVALRKLVNPARNCGTTQTFRVENDRSNRVFGTRFLPKRSEIYV